MKNQEKSSSFKIVWISIALLLVASYVFVFWYVKTKTEQATYALSAAEISYQQKDTVQEIAQSVIDIEEDLKKIDSYFVGADGIVDFINMLEQKAGEQSIEIETSNVSIVEPAEDLLYGESLEVVLSVVGDWNDVMQYIRLVEGLPYALSVESASMSLMEVVTEEEGAEPFLEWQADIVVRVIKHQN